MAWIRTIEPEESTGHLKKIYDAAIARAGQVWNIIKLMSLRPRQVETSMGLYQAVMFGRSELSRGEREMIATVVSDANHCRY